MALFDALPPPRGIAVYDGLIKLKLVHAEGFSTILPDVLAIGAKWFQAKFFSPALLSWFPGGACCRFSFELDARTRLDVLLASDSLMSVRNDGSGVYRCRVGGPANLGARADGECVAAGDGEIALWLYHHTESHTVDAIRASGHFRGSEWNIQGTKKKLVNVRYVYFTSVPRIKSDADLELIAMASTGVIKLTPTNAPNDIVFLPVYRESTRNRRSSLRTLVPADALASQHVYRHPPVGGAVYYEIPHACIFRVGLLPGKILPIKGDEVVPVRASLKSFDYVVLGNADTRIGLRAPYDEEETPALFKIERMTLENDLFSLWQKFSNSDRFNGYSVQMAGFTSA